MRCFANLQVLATFDVDQIQQAFNQQVTFDDTDPGTASTTASGLISLAPSASAIQVPFGGVTNADTVLLIAYGAIKIQLDSNTAPLVDIIPVPAALAAAVTSPFQRESQPGLFFMRGKLTSLYLTNPSSSDIAPVFFGLIGEAA